LRNISFEDAEPGDEIVSLIADVLGSGGVAILPTDTIYGLHACAGDRAAVGRIIAAKERDDGKPLVVLASDLDQVVQVGAIIEPDVRDVLSAIWPAPLTAILPLVGELAASRGIGSIAVRVPRREWLRRLLSRTGPLASSSVNRSGSPPAQHPDEIDPAIAASADLLVTGPALEGSASTIVDFTGGEPRVIRQGEFLFAQNLWKTSRNSL
jgi:L-threonylcarbamoyladenylate synthase